jgi:hypothetical protein
LILRTERSAEIETRTQYQARCAQLRHALKGVNNTIARRIQIAADRHVCRAPQRIHG